MFIANTSPGNTSPENAKTYRIETERLLVRCYEPTDAPRLLESITESVEHLMPWLPWPKNEPEDLQAKIDRLRLFRGKFDLGLDYVFGIFDRSGDHLLGSTGLHTRLSGKAREIGYWIGVSHVNKGYATEAVSALLRIGFEIESLDRIEIHCDPENHIQIIKTKNSDNGKSSISDSNYEATVRTHQ